MPAADLAMQRKVPTRLIWMIMLKASIAKRLDFAGVAVAADGLRSGAGSGAVDQDPLLAVGGAGRIEGRIDLFLRSDVGGTEDAADFLGDVFALFVLTLEIEDGDLDALGRERARRRFTQAGRAAGDHRGDGGIKLHGRGLPVRSALATVRGFG